MFWKQFYTQFYIGTELKLGCDVNIINLFFTFKNFFFLVQIKAKFWAEIEKEAVKSCFISFLKRNLTIPEPEEDQIVYKVEKQCGR